MAGGETQEGLSGTKEGARRNTTNKLVPWAAAAPAPRGLRAAVEGTAGLSQGGIAVPADAAVAVRTHACRAEEVGEAAAGAAPADRVRKLRARHL